MKHAAPSAAPGSPKQGQPLHLVNLTKRFGNKVAVDTVNLCIEPGSFVGVIGRSGAGKSTLLRMINRLVDPSSGAIRYGDQEVTALTGNGLRGWRAQAAMVFQHFNLVGRVDVLTNVTLGRLHRMGRLRGLLGWWSDEDRSLALAALDQFDMGELAPQRADSLSGGQQQRVALARALAQEPRLILADEPIASLDPRNTRIVMDALARLNREFGITVICNLHSVDLARQYCGRLVGMADGRVVFDGCADALTPSRVRQIYGMEADDLQTVTTLSPLSTLQPEPHLSSPLSST